MEIRKLEKFCMVNMNLISIESQPYVIDSLKEL